MSASMSVESIDIGPYLARIRGWEDVTDTSTYFEYEVDLRVLRALRTLIDNAIERLTERQTKDAVCGDCKVCKNHRMVTVERHGNPWREYCPKCHPKLEAAEKKGLLQ